MIITKLKSTNLILISLILFLSSCISDDYDSCYGIRICVNYPNDQERCKTLDIYVFDHQGSLFAKYEKIGRQVQPGVSYLIQVPEGRYSIVVWGDVNGQYSYVKAPLQKESQIVQSIAGNYLPTSEFWRYRVVTDVRSKGSNILSEELTSLFHTSEYQVELKAKETKDINLNLVKNTNKIQLKISGLPDGVSYENLDLGIIARNGQYHFNNSIPYNADEILYKPYLKMIQESSEDVGKSAIANLSILRLIKGRNPLLYIKDGETGSVLYQHNLVELLMSLPYVDLDKEDYYEIDLDFRGPTVSIKINGWNVLDSNQDIS